MASGAGLDMPVMATYQNNGGMAGRAVKRFPSCLRGNGAKPSWLSLCGVGGHGGGSSGRRKAAASFAARRRAAVGACWRRMASEDNKPQHRQLSIIAGGGVALNRAEWVHRTSMKKRTGVAK